MARRVTKKDLYFMSLRGEKTYTVYLYINISYHLHRYTATRKKTSILFFLQSRQDEEQVRCPVQVAQYLRVFQRPLLSQGDGFPFPAPDDCAGQVQGR